MQREGIFSLEPGCSVAGVIRLVLSPSIGSLGKHSQQVPVHPPWVPLGGGVALMSFQGTSFIFSFSLSFERERITPFTKGKCPPMVDYNSDPTP